MRLNKSYYIIKTESDENMVKMICPVCKIKMQDKVLKKEYECSNCKSHLKISKPFWILYTIPILIGCLFPVIGFILAQHAISDNNNLLKFLLKYIICPLMGGLFAGSVSFLLMSLYPKKLTKIT